MVNAPTGVLPRGVNLGGVGGGGTPGQTSNMFDTQEKVAWGIKLSKIHPHTVSYRLS